MPRKIGVANEDCFDSKNNVLYTKNKPYQVDDRDPFIARHFTFTSQKVDKALEQAESEKNSDPDKQ